VLVSGVAVECPVFGYSIATTAITPPTTSTNTAQTSPFKTDPSRPVEAELADARPLPGTAFKTELAIRAVTATLLELR